jgi:hypothetical protein
VAVTRAWLIAVVVVASGCLGVVGGNGSADMNSNGSGGNGGGNNGPLADMALVGDMTDVTPIPAPMAKHVGATGATLGLVSDGNQHAAYLLNPVAAPFPHGELHVTDAAGNDVKVAASAFLGGYVLAPDGKSLLFTQLVTGATTASLSWLDLTQANATPKTILAAGYPAQPIDAQNDLAPVPLVNNMFFSPSSRYALLGVATTLKTGLDLHVLDLHAGNDAYQRGNGAFSYFELVLPDDTMIFQDTAGGTSIATPPVQTLYWLPLASANTATATMITTRTSQVLPTADSKTLVILKTNGDVLTWDLTAKSGNGTRIASGVARLALGTQPNGPIAVVGADRSVHVLTTDNRKLLDLDGATAAADVTGPVALAGDGGDVYWWQAVDTENNRGTLFHATVGAGAMPNKIGTAISLTDLRIVDGAVVLLQNVDAMGQFGDAVRARRDGSGLTALGTKVNVGGLVAVNPGPDTWFAMHLTGATASTSQPADGSLPLTGALAWDDYLGGNERTLDPAVHAGSFAFSDDGRDVVFVGGASFNATAGNFTGALKLLATRAPMSSIDGAVAGVSEVGPIVSRALFVNAPGATPAGIYFVKY